MVVYLAPDTDRMTELDSAVRDFLGWSHVLANSTELDLTENQRNQAADKKKQTDDTAAARLLGTYQWILAPTAPDPSAPFVIDATKAEGQAASLAERVSKRLGNDGALFVRQAAATIRLALDRVPALWQSGHVAVGALWKQYATYPYMPRLRDQTVLSNGLVDQPLLWQQDGFALAIGYDDAADRYQGLWIPDDGQAPVVTDTTLVVQPSRAAEQRAAEVAAAQAAKAAQEGQAGASADAAGQRPDGPPDAGSAAAGTTSYSADGRPTEAAPPPKPAKKRFFGSKELNPDRYAMDFKKISDEVIAHLAASGSRLAVRIEIEAVSDTGFDDGAVRTVSENATQLKFDQSGFEEA